MEKALILSANDNEYAQSYIGSIATIVENDDYTSECKAQVGNEMFWLNETDLMFQKKFSFEYKAPKQDLFGETANVPKMVVHASFIPAGKPEITVFAVNYNGIDIFGLLTTYLQNSGLFELLEKEARTYFESEFLGL